MSPHLAPVYVEVTNKGPTSSVRSIFIWIEMFYDEHSL